jgi:formate dehydrogenase iron-sulfur subunit
MPVDAPPSDPSETPTLIDELLREQRMLTAVAQFSQKHDREELPLQSRYYRDLIPLARPAPGEQYAFEVDLDKCSGCKACVAACHSLNGLEVTESWRSVGLLIGGAKGPAYQQTVTTACHHCVDPGCLNGCPVLAYEKDEATGIVRHLDDQCIGCQYCVLKCPYEVPQYSSRLGIVRKCDMCAGRLQDGEAPACVQSCPNEAIRITVVVKDTVRQRYSESADAADFLPATPEPRHTLPATIYRSERGFPASVQAVDAEQLEPAAAHWPLAVMLVLTQASVGAFAWETVLRFHTPSRQPVAAALVIASLFGLAGLAASVLHLGKPLKAWRCFLGLRRSWLSREVLVFGAFAGGIAAVLAKLGSPFPLASIGWLPILTSATILGTAGVCCSMMVYADSPRELWRFRRTAPDFAFTTLLLGTAAAWATGSSSSPYVLLLLLVVSAARLLGILRYFAHLSVGSPTALKRSAMLMVGALRTTLALRCASVVLAGVLAPSWLLASGYRLGALGGGVVLGLFLLSELAGRSLFFRAVAQPKMPGGLP